MRSRTGLTLFETIVAIALSVIVAGAAGLAHQRLRPGWELNGAVRQIVLDLATTRTRAITEGRAQRLRFETPGSSYERQRLTPSRRYEGFGPAIMLPDSVQVTECTARGNAISFQPRGHAGSFGTLTLRNSLGLQRQVVVDIAGRARVQ